MNELDGETPRMASTMNETPAQTAGTWLREARQQRGLHIAALAAMLKVPQAKLEALEANRFDDLPDVTFARALAKAMCRVLKVDAEPVMALLPRGGERALDVSRGINQPYREWDGRDDGGGMAWLRRPVVWGAALLLLAAVAVYVFPASWLSSLSSTPSAVALPEPVAASAPMAAELQERTASMASTGEPRNTVPVPLAVPPMLTPAVPAVPAASMPVVGAADGAAAVVAAAPTVPPPLGAVPLQVKATGDSWVEIIDGRGQVLISRLLRAGDGVELAGLPPFKATVGNARATSLSLRGSVVDVLAQASNNVARLELK